MRFLIARLFRLAFASQKLEAISFLMVVKSQKFLEVETNISFEKLASENELKVEKLVENNIL